MTDKEQIERISKLLNELSLNDITSITEFDEAFSEQSINDIKDEMWKMYCFAKDVCDTINMGDKASVQKPKTGHWILDETDNSITCVKCGCLIWANDIHHGEAYYCPNCGSRNEVSE